MQTIVWISAGFFAALVGLASAIFVMFLTICHAELSVPRYDFHIPSMTMVVGGYCGLIAAPCTAVLWHLVANEPIMWRLAGAIPVMCVSACLVQIGNQKEKAIEEHKLSLQGR